MQKLLLLGSLAALGANLVGCAPSEADAREQSEVLAKREARYTAALAGDDSASGGPIARWNLPESLREISGLTLTTDGRLFSHGDETAEISEIDYKRGVILKNFLLGDNVVRDDFEGIAAVGDRFFMMTSASKLYEFKEGDNKARVQYAVHDAGLANNCEFEGVAYDSTSNALVLPCKEVRDSELEDQLVLYRWSLDSAANPRVTRITAPLSRVLGSEEWGTFHCSDITVDPKTGNYVIVAAQEKGLIVITPKGEPVSARALDDMHNQVEGVAITSDGVLILSDEIGKKQPAALTLYRWK